MNVVGKYRYYMDSAGEHGRLPIIVDIILVRDSVIVAGSHRCMSYCESDRDAFLSSCPAWPWQARIHRRVPRKIYVSQRYP